MEQPHRSVEIEFCLQVTKSVDPARFAGYAGLESNKNVIPSFTVKGREDPKMFTGSIVRCPGTTAQEALFMNEYLMVLDEQLDRLQGERGLVEEGIAEVLRRMEMIEEVESWNLLGVEEQESESSVWFWEDGEIN